MRGISFSNEAYSDFIDLSQTDAQLFNKIASLIEECCRTPFKGRGNPEPLRHLLTGCWSRRINSEHRLVYKVSDETVFIVSCKYHYH